MWMQSFSQQSHWFTSNHSTGLTKVGFYCEAVVVHSIHLSPRLAPNGPLNAFVWLRCEQKCQLLTDPLDTTSAQTNKAWWVVSGFVCGSDHKYYRPSGTKTKPANFNKSLTHLFACCVDSIDGIWKLHSFSHLMTKGFQWA